MNQRVPSSSLPACVGGQDRQLAGKARVACASLYQPLRANAEQHSRARCGRLRGRVRANPNSWPARLSHGRLEGGLPGFSVPRGGGQASGICAPLNSGPESNELMAFGLCPYSRPHQKPNDCRRCTQLLRDQHSPPRPLAPLAHLTAWPPFLWMKIQRQACSGRRRRLGTPPRPAGCSMRAHRWAAKTLPT